MKYMRDMPIAIDMPLLAPVKGLETGWFYSDSSNFIDFDAAIDSQTSFLHITSGKNNVAEIKTKLFSQIKRTKIMKLLSLPIMFSALMSSASAENKHYDKYRYGVGSPLVGKNSTIEVARPDIF